MLELNPFVRPQSNGPPGDPSLERILTGRRKAGYVVGVLIWLGTLAFFWVWWLSPNHVIGLTSFIVVSAVLAWTTLLPLYCVVIVYKSVRPVAPLRIPSAMRVAMVLTKAPSEPFAVVASSVCFMQ